MKADQNVRPFARVFILAILSIILVTVLAAGCSRGGRGSYSISIDGEKVQTPPEVTVEQGEVFVPAAFLEQSFGVKMEWALKQQATDGIYYKDQVAVLMYHDIRETGVDDKPFIPSSKFRDQLVLLKQSGFHVISLKQYVDFIQNDGQVPDNAVLITFDDGYETFYTDAFPILKEFGYPAVNFVIVSDIEVNRGAKKMTWAQMREMQQSGMDFYSHTYDQHRYGAIREDGLQKPMLTRQQYFKKEKRMETEEEFQARVKGDLSKAEAILKEQLNNPMSVLAFPYGAYNEEVLSMMKELGIEISFTVKEGINGRGQTNGFRINGAKDGESVQQLIEKLKALPAADGTALAVSMNGRPADFGDLEPMKLKGGALIPLREFCQMNQMKLKWNKYRNKISIET
ncbi:polysaccharide deacetylase family protein [Paenibacillus sp. NPDC058071]|uniref:polysaccharide deacetylase family protein n=1 Tax=Paenibacillus sp. NPDC058071 TaxID=3346326 RepID=UPI0036DA0C10